MAKKSKLLAALDAHKGRDFEAEKRKKQVKSAEKRKRRKLEALQKSGGVGSDQEDVETHVTLENAAHAKPADNEFASFSDSPDEDNADDEVRSQNGDSSIPQTHIPASASASEADPESDVPLSDLSEDDRE